MSTSHAAAKARRLAVAAALAGALAAALALAGCGSAAKPKPSPGPSAQTGYYLALGDSLAAGYQPGPTGSGVLTHVGYVDDLYAHYSSQIQQLKLVNMSCPGDTTTNVITGQGNATAAKQYHCDRSGGSQLKAAVAFVKAHAGHVKLITIDIGGNDINDCLNLAMLQQVVAAHNAGPLVSCVNKGEQAVRANLPKILGALKAAAAPGTALVGGNIYDPFLAFADPQLASAESGLIASDNLNSTEAQLLKQFFSQIAPQIASGSLSLISKLNQEIAWADTQSGFKTADLADAFDTYDTKTVSAPSLGGSAPRNVVTLCSYTWSCSKSHGGPNVHPNKTGYAVIARAYQHELGSLQN